MSDWRRWAFFENRVNNTHYSNILLYFYEYDGKGPFVDYKRRLYGFVYWRTLISLVNRLN